MDFMKEISHVDTAHTVFAGQHEAAGDCHPILLAGGDGDGQRGGDDVQPLDGGIVFQAFDERGDAGAGVQRQRGVGGDIAGRLFGDAHFFFLKEIAGVKPGQQIPGGQQRKAPAAAHQPLFLHQKEVAPDRRLGDLQQIG